MSRSTQDPTLEAAVAWRVRLESRALRAGEQQAFESWLAASIQHQAAWERVGAVLDQPLSTIRALQPRDDAAHVRAATEALARPPRRRALRGALAIAGVGGVLGVTADRLSPLAEWSADLHTRTAQRRSFALASGAQVLLDARSAVDVRAAGPDDRWLVLRAGALVLTDERAKAEVGTHAGAHAGSQAWTIQTRDGAVTLEGLSLMCRLHDGWTEVVALEGRARLRQAGLTRVLASGEGARMRPGGIEYLPGRAIERAAWRTGMLAAEDWSLAEVVEAIRPYFPGFIRLSESAGRLRVFGVFRLDVDEILQTLGLTLPLRFTRLGPLVSIDLAPGEPAG